MNGMAISMMAETPGVFVVVRNLVDAVFATDVSSIGSIVYSCKQLKSGSKNNQIDTMKDSDWYSC